MGSNNGQIEAILASAVNDKCPGALAHVRTSDGHHQSFAAGTVDLAEPTPLDPGVSFRIASVTKTFVAASVLRLAEDSVLDLEDPLDRHLSAPTLATLSKGGYDPSVISVWHLLTHTSGLPDHTHHPDYAPSIRADMTRQWTAAEQIEWACLRMSPVGEVGAQFHYSDTGYVILGELLTRSTGLDLASGVRGLCGLDGLGLRSTWWEELEAPPAGSAPVMATQYLDDRSLLGSHPSMDLWGGGGLVSTTADLVTFYRALLDGRVLSKHLPTMLTVTSAPDNERSMGSGIYRIEAGTGEWWGHSGFWNVCAFADRTSEAAVSVAVLQLPEHTRSSIDLATEIIGSLA